MAGEWRPAGFFRHLPQMIQTDSFAQIRSRLTLRQAQGLPPARMGGERILSEAGDVAGKQKIPFVLRYRSMGGIFCLSLSGLVQ
jgi:hypothetical protein